MSLDHKFILYCNYYYTLKVWDLNIYEFSRKYGIFVIDERYSEYEIQQEDPQNEVNVQKISVMQDRFQLKVGKGESTAGTGNSSISVYYQTQKAHDLFGYLFSCIPDC